MNSVIGVSIIVPCYNSGSYLKENVSSIFSQPFKYPFEVLIVDDGSTEEETLVILNQLEKESNLTIIRHLKNLGVQSARNSGLKKAKFDFILMIDADDCLNTEKNILKKGVYTDRAIDILITNPNVAFVQSPWLMFGGFTGFTISSYPVTESLVLKKHHVQTSIVYRKEEALQAGLYDTQIQKWQDWSFAVGILNYRFISGKKNNIHYLSDPYYLYRIHTNINRVSSRVVDEKEMIYKTFLKNPNIFRNYYKGCTDEEIIEKVLSNKPNRLKELLFVAKHNPFRAMKILYQRGLKIESMSEGLRIP